MLPSKNIMARIAAITLILGPISPAWARGNGTSAGLSLLEAPSARASGLAETMSAVANDVAGFAYNPASLGSLRSGQASFLYQKGVIDDSYGHLLLGRPTRRGGLGLSVGYYDAGDMEIFDGGGSRTVAAQRDLTVSLGTAGRIGRFGWGFAGKFLSSELIEKERATGYAADLGMTMAAGHHLRFGAALQNFGPQLKYIDEGDDLPQMARLGMALALPYRGFNTTVLVDASYRFTEQELYPSLGLEFSLSGLALRTGVRQAAGNLEVTAGTGFVMGKTAIDYSIGLTRDIDISHRISYSFRFGSANGVPSIPLFVRATPTVHPPMADSQAVSSSPKETIAPQVESRATEMKQAKTPRISAAPARTVHRIDQVRPMGRQVRAYTVRSGDTLASIAKAHYGDFRLWRRIYAANKHLLNDPTEVEVGQKLVLP